MIQTAIASMTISIAVVAVPASAQSFLSPRPGHGFATVGFVEVGGDPADDFNTFQNMAQPVNRGRLLVNAAVFVAPHVGVGIETLPAHDTTGVSTTLSAVSSEQLHEKTTLMITGRGCVLARSRFAVDGVFGVGALRQTRMSTTDFNDPRSPNTTTTTDNTSAAFSLGADTKISLAKHLALIPQMRWYHLRRLGNQRYSVIAYPSSVLDTPGWLFALGVTAGVTW
jgi:hypothetical protein